MPRDPAADHLDSLYRTDRHGRLTGINQWDGGTAPRFHLVRSLSGNHWRFRAGLEPPRERELELLCRAEPIGGDLRRDPELAAACLDLLGPGPVWRGPVFSFPDPSPTDLSGVQADGITAVTQANADLLRRWLPDWLPDVPHRQPFIVAVERGDAVAVCASVRISTSTHAAGVETHPAFRGRGFARRVVGAWSEAVRRKCAAPMYSTSWDNVASQRVAASLGLELIAADFHVG